ncbi:MAG: inositol monophosphatase [Geminicoccaceae bacterium]|nr:inositol monophosphatase [Geminicoccaceae bacterium]
MSIDPELRLAAACAVARQAGALALRHFRARDRLVVERKGLQDLVSAADREVEATIRDRLAHLFPEDGFLGEEGGRATGTAGTWVVDPIDGTWCFLSGIASWCVSLAWVRDGRIELGVIYDPCADELFAARAGGGATLDGRPIRVADATSLAEGTVSVGFSHRSRPEEVAPVFGRLLAAGGMYHRHGSGALGLAWTACGRLIGYIEPHMNSWDALAGLLLVAEAGGRVNDFLAGDGLVAGNRVVAVAPGIAHAIAELVPWARL